MTADDYAIIRERLDHPQVVVWDLCAPTLALDDPEWPAMVTEDPRMAGVNRLTARAIVRCLLVAGERALAMLKPPTNTEPWPHQALDSVRRWLTLGLSLEDLENALNSGIDELNRAATPWGYVVTRVVHPADVARCGLDGEHVVHIHGPRPVGEPQRATAGVIWRPAMALAHYLHVLARRH